MIDADTPQIFTSGPDAGWDDGAFNSAAIALLAGCTVSDVEAATCGLDDIEPIWRAGRRRWSEAEAASGMELGAVEVCGFWALRSHCDLAVDGELVVSAGVPI